MRYLTGRENARASAGWRDGAAPPAAAAMATAAPQPPSFTVMSYNLLANVYANTAEAREELFPYCSEQTLSIAYRAQLLLKEILSARPSILW
jgi:mRNA deadenylase 3'-5' endonuclease subunit Ccr4